MSVRWPRLLTPTHLSQLIRVQKNPLKALQIFNEAKTRYPNYHHNGPVYATMIKILGTSGRISYMKEMINRMKNDSCECQDLLFADIIKTYANVGLLNEAISLFNSLPQFNCVNYTESFNTLLGIMVNESKLEDSYNFFMENCKGWEIKSRARSLKLLMSTLCGINRSDLALHIFQEMGYLWCYPDSETYRTLMRGLCLEGRFNEAINLLYLMLWRNSRKDCGAHISIYRILLEALCDNGEIEEAMEVLEKILRKGLKAPKRYFYHKRIELNELLDKYDSNISYAKALMNEALIRGGSPGSDGYKSMAVDFYSEGRVLHGDLVLEEMYKKGFTFKSCLPMYEAKIAALFREGKVDEVMDVVENEMVDNNCVPNVKFHNIVIKGLCDVRESNRAVRYLEKMGRQIGCVCDKETYEYLVDGLCLDGKYVEASGILEKMAINGYWPKDEVYSKVIKGLCLIGKTYKAVVWLEEMIDRAMVPEMSVWCSLVSSVCSEREVLGVTLYELEKL